MARVIVHGVNLYYEECGRGYPLICLPGALGSGSTDFGLVLETWAKRFRVVSVDPRGYGQSRPPDRDFSGDFFLRDAEDVNALAESIGCLEYFLAGWSDGANVAVLVAAQHPARVRKLVLWGGNSDIRPDDVKGLDQTRDLSNWPRRRRLALQAVYGDRLVELWNSYCDGMHHLHLRGGEICGDRLREVRCPTLVIHGEQDPLISEDRARAFQNGITGAEFHLIRGGRHNVHLTHHEEFDEVMLRFLDKTL